MRERYVLTKEAFDAWLEVTPCADCGRVYPAPCMQLDHARGRKARCVGSFMSCTDALLRELKKCDVVCANCHALRTHRRGQLKTKRRLHS